MLYKKQKGYNIFMLQPLELSSEEQDRTADLRVMNPAL
jgi:hypothetical protein